MHEKIRTRIFSEDFRYSSAEHWRHVARSSCSRNRGRKEGQRGETSLRNSDEQPRFTTWTPNSFFLDGGVVTAFPWGGKFFGWYFFYISKGNVDDMALFLRVFSGFQRVWESLEVGTLIPTSWGTWFVECPYWCNYSYINVTINPRWFIYKHGGVVHL